MSLADIVRSAVAIADSVTKPLQANVTFSAWIGQDGTGNDQFAAPVVLFALVDRTRKPFYTKTGKEILTLATVTFLDPVAPTAANNGQQRVNPVDPRDQIVLDDGVTAPIIMIKGFEDAGLGNGTPFLNEVTLGAA